MKTFFYTLLIATCVAAPLSAQTIANYQAEVMSQSPSNYFKLDGTLASTVNPGVVLESFAGGYASDAYRNATNCWFFVDQNTAYLRYVTTPLINGGGTSNTISTAKGSITFLFRALSGPNTTGGRTLFDASTVNVGTTNHNGLALFFESPTASTDTNALRLRFGNSTTTIIPQTNVIYGAWYYFALTYDESRTNNKAIWHVGPAGGMLTTGMTTNSIESVAGDGTGLLIGQRADLLGAYRNPGSGRIDEFAIWARELSSTEISNQFSKLPQLPAPGSTYQQVVTSQIPKYYFKLDNSFVDSVGNTLLLKTNDGVGDFGTNGAFTSDILGNPFSAYSFTSTNDALFITNDLINGGGPTVNASANGVGTISFQFRMLSDTNNGGQRFLFAAPAIEVLTTDDNQLALFLESNANTNNPGSLKLRVGNTTKGNIGSTDGVPIAYRQDLVPNAWYYFAMTYDESRNTVEVATYFGKAGGTLITSSFNPANNSVVGDNGTLWIGNAKDLTSGFRNPGSGAINEFAIWHDELTPTEIAAQFAAITPSTPPTLNIAAFGGDVLLSWTTTGTSGYNLESSPSLSTPVWTGAGSPTVVGSNNYVTNAASGSAKYYRLKK